MSVTKIDVGDFYSFKITKHGNCKLVYIDNIQGCIRERPDETLIELSNIKRADVLFFNLTQLDVLRFLCENFELLYCNRLPIGYNNNFQYHAGFRCKNPRNSKYDKRIKDEGINSLTIEDITNE